MSSKLVQTLTSGPLDIVGDVHGDLTALERLFERLGYSPEGVHPQGRSLVFVGDLVDRGPDSPGVVRWVRTLVEQGRANCVLGNHEFNLLLEKRKLDNGWFFGEVDRDPGSGRELKSVLADDQFRSEFLEWVPTLPLVLHREDVRIVHACWQPEMVAIASLADDTVALYQKNHFSIGVGLASRRDLTESQREMRKQNLNPVKVLTSGLEIEREPSDGGNGRESKLERYPWWVDYQDDAYCFFGHYSLPLGHSRDISRAMCVDFGVGKRWFNPAPKKYASDPWRLAAFRYPEQDWVFDQD